MKSPRVIGLLLLTLCLLGTSVSAQISAGGEPLGFQKAIPVAIPTVSVAQPDFQKLAVEDDVEKYEAIPERFGYPNDVYYTLENSGVWQNLPNGDRVWRLRIEAPGAFSINLLYSRFYMPQGGRFFIYSEENSMILGAFTSRNNKPWTEFATAPIKGSTCILEYFEPAEVAGQGTIDVSRIVYGYKDIFFKTIKDAEKDLGESGSCNNNVICPEGDPWRDQIRSVAMILTSGGFRYCSGSMVNNVREDGTPYFLTANHCLGNETTSIFMFNYDSPSCTPNNDGPTFQTISGSTLLANYSTSDFGLLLLSAAPPEDYNVYYSGWSNINVASTQSTAIHHPSGDVKKISFDYDPVTSANYLSTSGTTHWRIGSWDDGTTEGGSSGSPLYDQNKRVVGQLHGGYASCSSLTSDWYGKFSMSWTGGGSSTNRLRDWLDPDNTGATTLDGFDPNATVTIVHTPLEDTQDYTNDYEVVALFTSVAPLIEDSLLLHYSTGGLFTDVTMNPTGNPDEYSGYIPAQTPGTVIDYYLSGRDSAEHYNESDTVRFKVIDYAMSLTPASLESGAVVGDSAYFTLTVTNDGVYDDDYTLSYSGNSWSVDIYDETGTIPIGSTGLLGSNVSFDFIVAVEIPASVYGDFDQFNLSAVSVNQAGLSESSTLTATSKGTVGAFPWFEDFPTATLSNVQWVFNNHADISTLGLNPPSGIYSLHLDGDEDTVITQAIDLSSAGSGANLSYYFQQGGGGVDPAFGDDLEVEYYNDLGQWVNLNSHSGGDPAMTEFDYANIPLPSDALHSTFQLRFMSFGSTAGYDDWFVDDIRLDYPPDMAISAGNLTQILGPDDQSMVELVIENNGLGALLYDIKVYPDFSKGGLFNDLVNAGEVNPATKEYPESYYGELADIKGVDDSFDGFAVEKDAGGPDLYGNYWIDSDQQGGPVFEWIDISSSGQDITYMFDDDNQTQLLEIAFSFPFYGSSYDSVCIGSNGIIGFDTANMDERTNRVIPYAGTPNNFIAWLWDDLDITDGSNPGGSVYFESNSNSTIIQFSDYPEYSGSAGDVVTAQVILYPNGQIRCQYQSIGTGFDIAGCTIGIENADASDGIEVAYNSQYLHDGLALVFYQPTAWLTLSEMNGTVEPSAADTVEITFNSSGLGNGDYLSNVLVYNNDPNPSKNPYEMSAELTVTDGTIFICGDLDESEMVDILDIIYFIEWKFKEGPAPAVLDAADVNNDGEQNILDITYLIEYKYKEGPAPSCP